MRLTTTRLAEAETLVVALLARAAPWLPPLPTAWLVYDRSARYLGWPPWVAGVAGAAVETLGLLVSVLAVQLYSYNRSKLKTEPAAPLWIPLTLAGAYVTVAELLIVGLDVAPRWGLGTLGLANWAPAAFPLLSLVGMILLATRVDHQARLEENAEASKERRAARRQKAAAGPPAETPRETAKTASAREQALVARFPAGQAFTRAEAETVLTLRSTAAGAVLADLTAAGRLIAEGRGRARRYHFPAGQ